MSFGTLRIAKGIDGTELWSLSWEVPLFFKSEKAARDFALNNEIRIRREKKK